MDSYLSILYNFPVPFWAKRIPSEMKSIIKKESRERSIRLFLTKIQKLLYLNFSAKKNRLIAEAVFRRNNIVYKCLILLCLRLRQKPQGGSSPNRPKPY